ncbi:MAG: hypothetical protein RLZZ70_475 [Candidatus Parcubacteria bacterium]|jgi:hypothetical protein
MFYLRFLLLSVFFLGVFASSSTLLLAQSGVPYTVDIVAYVPGCGDGIIQSGEQCDGTNFGGTSCSSVGLGSGAVQCSSVCTLITSACVPDLPRSSGSTQTDKTPDLPALTTTNVIVSGFAPPGAVVSILRDAQESGMAVAKADGSFQITVTGLVAGSYLLQVRAEAGAIHTVTTDTFRVQVIANTTTKISSVILGPLVLHGTNNVSSVRLNGLAVPNSQIEVWRQGVVIGTTETSATGEFTINTTAAIALGERIELRMTVASQPPVIVTFTHNFQPIETQAIDTPLVCLNVIDVSGECQVDLKDFAIAVYVFLFKPTSARIDFNRDGQIDLVDFSMMAFYWTG